MLNHLQYKKFGSRALLIEWPAQINEEILKEIIQLNHFITANKQDFIEECIIGYNSLTIVYLKEIIDINTEIKTVQSLLSKKRFKESAPRFLWKIPVCYDPEFGVDLKEMATTLQLTTQEIVELHTKTIYTVYFIGFLPGFLYLGGLNSRLEIKRKPNPRLHVTKGAVAIGGTQTGVYPMDSAGGWNILGRTPLSFFNPDSVTPCFAKPRDKIQFVSISRDEYRRLEIEIKLDTYKASKINWYG